MFKGSSNIPGRRFPAADLLSLLPARSPADQAKYLNVSKRSIHRFRHEGFSLYQADFYAVQAGYHPAEVWPGFTETTPPEGVLSPETTEAITPPPPGEASP